MSVLVLTDTAASLAPEDAAAYGVRLVPLTVIVAGRAYRDTDLDATSLPGGRATTAGPPPAEYLDSRSAAGGQALVALAAADCASRGRPLAEAAGAARAAAAQVQLVGCLRSLDGLARTGRVPGLAMAAAHSTGLQFMFTLRNGVIRPMMPATTPAAAAERMIDLCVSTGSPGTIVDVITLGDTGELRQRFAAAVDAGRLPVGRVLAANFGNAITLYTGPHVTGLAWRWRGPAAP